MAEDPYDIDYDALLRAVPLKRIVIAAGLALAALYAGDLLVASLRGGEFDTVTVTQVYAVPQKNNRVDFEPAGDTAVRCVNALFPHFGASPCWYLKRHTSRRIDM